jgi:NodT family efflux transporter outer membrane factor (OMF) lipoprotein
MIQRRATSTAKRAALASLALLSACAVGPDFERPAPPKATSFTAQPLPAETSSTDAHGGNTQHLISGRDIPAEWWTLFHSKKLDALIAEALKANPTVDAAQAALREAKENVYVQEAQFFPTATASLSATRNQNSGTLAPTLTNNVLLFNLYTPQLSVSYMPDVFGLNRRTVESLEALAEYQRWELEATTLTLASNVVVAAIEEASLRGQIAATEETIQIGRNTLAMTEQGHALGQLSNADVAAQRAQLAQTEAALPPLRKQLAQQRDALTALLGRLPSEEPGDTFELNDLELPQDLPLSLPSQLVEQRPDIRAAEADLHSASAGIGVAIASALPQITLSATGGSAATTFADLFSHGTGFGSIGGEVAQTAFDAGASVHKVKAARRAFDQAAAQYKETVITAFQNVADTLHALSEDAEALKACVAAERAAKESLTLAQDQFWLGQISRLALASAELTYQQSLIARVQAEANRYADTAALFQALGGGWWNRPEVADASSRQ